MATRQVPLCQCPELRPSTAILRRWISRLRTENGDFAGGRGEVSVIGYAHARPDCSSPGTSLHDPLPLAIIKAAAQEILIQMVKNGS